MVQDNLKVEEYAALPGLELGEAASKAIVLLPTSRQEDGKFVALQSTKTTLKVLLQGGVPTVLAPDSKDLLLFKDQRGFDWYGPTLFVGAALLTQEPNIVAVALSLIANYVHDLFAGSSNEGKVHLTVVVEESKGGKKKEIRYTGPVDGLKGVADVVKSTHERGK